jgi:hypothetical protein
MKCLTRSGSAASVSSFRPSITLALAAAAMLFAGHAMAQSTSAHIFGQGPAGAKVEAHSTTGTHRTTLVKDNGRYDLRSLPMGNYTVTLWRGDTVTDTRANVRLMVGRGAEVDFACPHDQCAADAPKSP